MSKATEGHRAARRERVGFGGLLGGLVPEADPAGAAGRRADPGQLGYLENQVGGRGCTGLAAMIFGNVRPVGLLAGSALFRYVDGLHLRAGGEAALALGGGLAVYALYWTIDTVPGEFATYAPQLVTLLVLAVASQRLRPPAALGAPYRRGEGA